MSRDQISAQVQAVSQALSTVRTRQRLLDEVGWPRSVETAFFAAGGEALPHVEYTVDRDRLQGELALLQAVERQVDGDGPVHRWLRATIGSHIDRHRLLLATGTPAFGNISAEVYGSARRPFFGLSVTNLDLADHLMQRLAMHGWDEARDTPEPPMDALQFAGFLRERIARRKLPLEVDLDPDLTSKAIAGSRRIRIRSDATFTSWEAEGLYRHEIETHAFTALNGAQSDLAPLLKNGGPRSTPTQEGLAVFAELYHRALAVPRLQRLALRVKLVAQAEDGASFLDVYRYLLHQGYAPRDAYLDAARVFRGGPPAGGGPFTKDACYLAGLVHVHAFLAAFVRAGFRDECEMLVSGRFALDDVSALLELRGLGLLPRPRWRPRWLREWNTLLPYFAFASFLDGIDLAPVTAHHAEAIRIAHAAQPAGLHAATG